MVEQCLIGGFYAFFIWYVGVEGSDVQTYQEAIFIDTLDGVELVEKISCVFDVRLPSRDDRSQEVVYEGRYPFGRATVRGDDRSARWWFDALVYLRKHVDI